jgi:hypothetical protein
MSELGSAVRRGALVAAMSMVVMLLPAPVQAAQSVARGTLPSDRLHFGLANSPGAELDWLVSSGVPWRYRYQYLSGGINTAGGSTDPCAANIGWQTWNSPAGQFATLYIKDSVAHSTIPVFTYYEIVQSNPSQGVESALPTKITTVCTMQRYWADFTVLMQKVGAYGGPVVVHVEPDFWGFMEQQSADPTTLSAKVAGSGNADLVGLPDTVAGMGLAFLKLRDKYAPNAILGIHVSSWASGIDIATDQSTTVNAAAEADKIASFIDKAGIVGNPSGITPWDVIFNDVADHDAASYGALSNNHWWDRNNVLFPNFTRWLAFMSRIHTDTGLPLVEWQVPVGNQYFDTMNNTDGHYQDNRAEYFLAHTSQLTASGIVAVLFGKANAGQTTYVDYKGDGTTNPGPVTSWQCAMCNNHTSTVADDDGGFLRLAVGAYYAGITFQPCTSVTASPAPASPQAAGTAITLTAVAVGCSNPRYQFWTLAPGGTWTIAQPYSSSATFNWNTTGLVAGVHHYSVWVRDTSSAGSYDAFTGSAYTLTSTSTGCASVTASAAPASPQPPGTAISISASTAGCSNPRYQFWILAPGGSWTIAQPYSSNSMFAWNTTALAVGTYHYSVWVRDAGSASSYDAYTGNTYVLTSTACALVTASPAPASPQAAGTPVIFSASASGCPNPRYQFWILAPGGAWTIAQAYSSNATFNWITTGLAAGVYHYSVWVRDAASGAGYDAYTGNAYTLTSITCPSVTASAAPASPQAHGTSVTFTASASGCPNPRYQFWILAPGGAWTIAQPYSSGATFNWNTSGLSPGIYHYSVWVRDAGSAAGYDAYFSGTAYRLT